MVVLSKMPGRLRSRQGGRGPGQSDGPADAWQGVRGTERGRSGWSLRSGAGRGGRGCEAVFLPESQGGRCGSNPWDEGGGDGAGGEQEAGTTSFVDPRAGANLEQGPLGLMNEESSPAQSGVLNGVSWSWRRGPG